MPGLKKFNSAIIFLAILEYFLLTDAVIDTDFWWVMISSS